MNNYTKKTLNEYISFTESTLKKFSYKNKLGLQSSVADAMNYSLEAGGKRIRPVLVLAFCHMCGGDYRKAAAPAAAIEMIHTFSLIHDDLPCMDNDDFRRGKPSCHKKFGEACAVLAGDALAIRPFQVIAESELNDSMKIKLIAELACSSGAEGMIGGQIIDMENDVDQMQIDYQEGHVERMAAGDCSIEAGLIFTDLVIGLERIADHAVNIAYSILPEKK